MRKMQQDCSSMKEQPRDYPNKIWDGDICVHEYVVVSLGKDKTSYMCKKCKRFFAERK